MALFVDILIHPLGARARSDLEILHAAVGIIGSIPSRFLSSAETEHIHGLGDFLMDLFRLGNCAVWKAEKEGDNSERGFGLRVTAA